MRKKFFAIILSLTAMVSGSAQQSVGEWTFFPRFLGSIESLVATPEKTYYTSGGRLFSFDKENNETYAYSTQNRLNDTNVGLIVYNPFRKCLVVTYDNGNIDLLYDSDRTVNMSDIKDANILTGKAIRSINFDGDKAYLATDFGFVIADMKKHEIIESGNFGFPIDRIDVLGDFLFLQSPSNGFGLRYARMDAPHNTADKFTMLAGMQMSWMKAMGNNMLYADNTGSVRKIIFGDVVGVQKPGVLNNVAIGHEGSKGIYANKDGWYSYSDKQIVSIDSVGDVALIAEIPTAIAGQLFSSWTGAKSVWGADGDGVAEYDISGAEPVVLSEKSHPVGIATDEVFFQKWDKEGRLWLGNYGPTQYKAGRQGDFVTVIQRVTRLDGETPEDVSLMEAKLSQKFLTDEQNRLNHTRLIGGVCNFAIDPFNSDRYYQADNIEGLFVIENGEQVHVFNESNSPFKGNWGARVMAVSIDHEDNLWVGCYNGGQSEHTWYVLPSAKLKGDITTVQPSDWRGTKFNDSGNKDMQIVVCSKSPAIFAFDGTWDQPLRALKTNSTLTNTSDDQLIELNGLVDQDGKPFSPDRWTAVVEDQKGAVWFGSTMGVVEITNPRDLNQNTRVNRIKVPRNDGTNYADYLCETDLINDIAVDASNRKWIATDASGVFLVSEKGDRIIEHFTKDNSPLSENCVLSVSCDPSSNKVYFGLLTGLVRYSSDSSPAADDFSEVYAYPNPVRPEYTGVITITNLMDNSLVKIADSAGHVIHQGRSEGGMYSWDGLDGAGNRVKSGVYFVYASQNETGSSKGAVTKIVVVN